jgi:Rrf2 family protein
MAVLARSDNQRLTNQEIARLLGASAHHLAKVMPRLAKMGLVDSIRGPQGGFVLGKPAKNVTLLEVYEAIDGPVDKSGCLFQNTACDRSSCLLGRTIESIHKQLRDYLADTTLEELAAEVGLANQVTITESD